MSFEFFVDESPFAAGLESDDEDQAVIPRKKTEEPVATTHVVELGKLEPSAPGQHAPGVIFPALAYIVTFIYLFVQTEYSKILIHLAAVFVGFTVERLRESIVRQMKLDEIGDESILGVAIYTVPIVIFFKLYQLCIAQPMDMLLAAMGFKVEIVDIDRIPMDRRKETFAVLLWTLMIPMIPFAYFAAFTLTIALPFLMVPYLTWVFFLDKSPRNGSRRAILRDNPLGKHFVNYFPITLERASPPLDPTGTYVFCFHPHGIISLGAMGCFALNATGFPELFPGIERRLLTLDTNFKVPFLREIILWLGVCSVARQSCDAILGRGPGSAICIVVGGAAESLETAEGTYRLVLKRKGFVKVACDNSASLVPVFAFGETDVFSVHHPEADSKLRKWQLWAQKKMGFAVPLFWGQGISSYNWGFLPKRKPINVVTGPPISTKAFKDRGLEGEALVNAVHEAYVQGLKNLFDQYKDKTEAGKARSESIRIVQ